LAFKGGFGQELPVQEGFGTFQEGRRFNKVGTPFLEGGKGSLLKGVGLRKEVGRNLIRRRLILLN